MRLRWEIGIGLFGLLFAAIVVFHWVPKDIQGAFLEATRSGKAVPGDAFFPMLLGIVIGVIAFVQIVTSLVTKQSQRKMKGYARLRLANLRFLLVFTGILAGCLFVLFWSGPLVLWLVEPEATYRQMVDTAPYKYIGLSFGGFLMTVTLIALTEGSVRLRSIIVSMVLVLVLILIFDVFLDNIQLPPNADF